MEASKSSPVTRMSKTFKDHQEVVSDPQFKHCLSSALQIIKGKREILPPANMRFKRTPLDSLSDMGYLNGIDKISLEFVLIANKSSNLPATLRIAIVEICNSAIRDMVAYYSTTLFNGMTFGNRNSSKRVYIRAIDQGNNLLYVNVTTIANRKSPNGEGTTPRYISKEEEWSLKDTFDGFESGKYQVERRKIFSEFPVPPVEPIVGV